MFHLDLQMTAKSAASFFLPLPKGNMQAESREKKKKKAETYSFIVGAGQELLKYIWLYNGGTLTDRTQ